MASSKRISLGFLLAFAVVAGTTLHLAAAARDDPIAPTQEDPKECGTPLEAMMPCADYLTKSTSLMGPSGGCCAGLKSVIKDAPICTCHLVNREFSKLLSAPLLSLRLMMMPPLCGALLPVDVLFRCIIGPVPPINTDPATPPSP